MITIQVISFDDGWDKIILGGDSGDEHDLERIDLKELFEAIPA